MTRGGPPHHPDGLAPAPRGPDHGRASASRARPATAAPEAHAARSRSRTSTSSTRAASSSPASGPRTPGARPASRRPPCRPDDRHDDLGYQGSPLGGFDQELARNRKLLDEHHVRHVPGLNEELGATSAWGSQLAGNLPGSKYDGVLGMWYGKAPGLDRAADSLRHGNFVGVSRTGGGLAVVGDDPSCKSSTIPSASESLLAALLMPVFYPGSVQEVVDLGLHA